MLERNEILYALALSYQELQIAHNIFVPTWHNFKASSKSSSTLLGGKNDPQVKIPNDIYFYFHRFSTHLGLPLNST
jgi:hypothetical protein